MSYNLAALHPNIARAYEIALTGNHSIQLIPSKDPAPKAEDIIMLCDFYGIDRNPYLPDIIVEVTPVDSGTILSVLDGRRANRFETLANINERIEATKENNIAVSSDLIKPCETLLKTAIDRLGFGFYETTQIIDVAKTIAKMAGSDMIKAEHMAEAIQYKSAQI